MKRSLFVASSAAVLTLPAIPAPLESTKSYYLIIYTRESYDKGKTWNKIGYFINNKNQTKMIVNATCFTVIKDIEMHKFCFTKNGNLISIEKIHSINTILALRSGDTLELNYGNILKNHVS